MKKVSFVMSVILVAFMAFGFVSAAFAMAQTPNLKINIYLAPDPENQALESGTIDINDWPLTKDWVDRWALMPTVINMRDYVELGMMEIDINNQQWPTGDSGSKMYNPGRPESVKAVEFRKAVACLLDRNAIVRDVLKGLGYRMDVPLPPFQSSFYDMINYTLSGYVYDYNKTRAISILDAAGFTLLPSGKRADPVRGGELQPIVFYIRQDDPNRRKAGEMLLAELLSVGIPVNAIITEKTVCYKNVMVLYAYNLYTGGWSLTTIPDQYYDLYSTNTYYGPAIGWSQNYPGFCNAQFDAKAADVKFAATRSEAEAAAKEAGYLFLKYCAIVPMYCSKAVKAYRTGWTGVVNNAGFGIDNYFTFLEMIKTSPGVNDTLNWGFKSDIEQLNQVSSEWLWDQNVLGLMYESIIGTNPFNLAPTQFFIGTSGQTGAWDASGIGGDAAATYINFTIRSGIKWHNTTGNPRKLLDVYDVNFSFYFQKACGPGIAWGYPNLANFIKCEVYPLENKVGVYYKYTSAWAYQWAGGNPILNMDIWGRLWNTSDSGWQMKVKNFDPATADINENGVTDLLEDGCGAWMFNSYLQGEYVTLVRDDQYYLTHTTIENNLKAMFHDGAGDVNRDLKNDATDLGLMARALGTTPADPPGSGWGQWNSEADLNLDSIVNLADLTAVTSNYGKTAG